MKKLIIFLFLSSFFVANAFSEVSFEADRDIIKNEAYISVGTVSCVGLFGGIFNSLADSISEAYEDSKSSEDEEPFEAFSIGLGYNLILLDFLGLGGFVNFEKFGTLDLVSAQLKLSVQYGFTHFKFYHAVSGGALFIEDNAVCPIFDITVLGLKLDFDDFNIFVEGCLPSTAFVKAGFAYYF